MFEARSIADNSPEKSLLWSIEEDIEGIIEKPREAAGHSRLPPTEGSSRLLPFGFQSTAASSSVPADVPPPAEEIATRLKRPLTCISLRDLRVIVSKRRLTA